MRPWAVGAAVLCLVAAGCMAGPGGRPMGPLLEARAACPFAYPDGVPVDCGRDVSVEVPWHALPAGWVCLDRWDDADQEGSASLWSDLAGAFAVEYAAPDWERKFYGRAAVGGQEVFFWGPNTGFLRFAGPLPASGEWTVAVDAFDAHGEPEVLSTPHLRMHVSAFAEEPWYVWAFSRGGQPFFFDTMGSGEGRWRPGHLSASGADFQVNATVETPVEGGGGYGAQPSAAHEDC